MCTKHKTSQLQPRHTRVGSLSQGHLGFCDKQTTLFSTNKVPIDTATKCRLTPRNIHFFKLSLHMSQSFCSSTEHSKQATACKAASISSLPCWNVFVLFSAMNPFSNVAFVFVKSQPFWFKSFVRCKVLSFVTLVSRAFHAAQGMEHDGGAKWLVAGHSRTEAGRSNGLQDPWHRHR